jgi:hypothetical protein
METIAVFVNDAAHARQMLQPMLEGGAPAHWVLVACPPTLTRHIGRYVSRSARLQWRERWAQALFAQLEPTLKACPGGVVERQVANRRLVEVSGRLAARLPGLRLLDARCTRLGGGDEPLTAGQGSAGVSARWAAPVVLATGMSAMLALAD